MNVKERAAKSVSEEDKKQFKNGCKTCWSSFVHFVDKFSELIFICALLATCGWNIMRMVKKDDPNDTEKDNIKNYMFANVILCVWYVVLALLIFQSMRGNEKIYKHFGFLRGKLSKAFFLLFCASLCFPISGKKPGFNINTWVGVFLEVCAVLQMIKFCGNRDDKDTNEEEALMDDSDSGNVLIAKQNRGSFSANEVVS